jgi:hypothetical protein
MIKGVSTEAWIFSYISKGATRLYSTSFPLHPVYSSIHIIITMVAPRIKKDEHQSVKRAMAASSFFVPDK